MTILIKKCISISLAGFLLALPLSNTASGIQSSGVVAETKKTDIQISDSIAYSDYLKKYESVGMATSSIELSLDQFVASENHATIQVGEENRKEIVTTQNGYVEWKFVCDEAAFYNINVLYYPMKGTGSDIVRNIKIDGETPYSEANNISFKRCYTNADEIKTDANGNQIQPAQTENPKWMSTFIYHRLG